MFDEIVLDGLLDGALVCAIWLILVSAATVGRKLADLEYQQEYGVNGVRRIQSVINVRTHAMRVFLGIVFVVITVLLLADAPMWVRTLVNRVLFALLMATYAISSSLDWLDERRQLKLLQARERGGRERVFAAGVKSAEASSPEAAPDDVAHVDIASIQPAAVRAIAEAVVDQIPEHRP